MASSLNSFNDPSGFRISRDSSLQTSEEDELPILEELGIDLSQIWEKIQSVVLFRNLKHHKNNDWDMAGENYTRNE